MKKARKLNKNGASVLLAAVFAARGTSFLFSKELLKSFSPMSILSVRFLLAFLVLAIIFFPHLRSCNKKSLKGGLILGALYTLCMVLEMYGLKTVDSGVSAFIENIAIVLVPLYMAVWKRKLPERKTGVSAVAAVVGVGFLSLSQRGNVGGISGIILTICAALVFGFCVIATERVSQGEADPVAIGIIQLGTMGVLSVPMAFLTGGLQIVSGAKNWGFMLLLVLLCSCFGFAFQPLGQRYVSPDTAAILTVVNPLTAGILGVLTGAETLSVTKAIGFTIILLVLVFFNLDTAKILKKKQR